jgi:hypothetical protein
LDVTARAAVLAAVDMAEQIITVAALLEVTSRSMSWHRLMLTRPLIAYRKDNRKQPNEKAKDNKPPLTE